MRQVYYIRWCFLGHRKYSCFYSKLRNCYVVQFYPSPHPQYAWQRFFFRMGQIWEMWKGNTGSLKMCLSLTVRSSAMAWILVTLWKNPECASIISDIFVSGIFNHKYRYYVASGHVRSPSSESVMFRIIIICIQMIMVSQWCTVIQVQRHNTLFWKLIMYVVMMTMMKATARYWFWK